MEEYVNLMYRPKGELICDFYIEPAPGYTLKQAAANIALESSTGTWTDVKTARSLSARLAARAFEIKGNRVRVAYKKELFEAGNVPQMMSSISGNIFGMKAVKNLRLEDIEFPSSIVKWYKGPQVGMHDIRKMTRIRKRPILGTIFKPKLGLTAKEQAQLGYMVYSAGIDYSKDDENLGSMVFNSFSERVTRMLDVTDRIKSEQGRTVVYAANITSTADEMLKRAQFVKDHGGKCIMIDVLTAGWSSLEYITKQRMGMVVHGHRAMHAALTRNKKHGVSMMVLAKLARLCGVSALHTGTVVGKMEGSYKEVSQIDKFMRSSWYGLKPTMPIASGGMHPGLVPKMLDLLSNDLIITFGGGLWGHPDGPEAGVKAIRQSVDAHMEGVSLKEYAKGHRELAAALEFWGDSRSGGE